MGRQQQGVLAGCGFQDPPGVPAQLLLDPPRPEDPQPGLAASQSDGLTNRRMRARMSGGVGGGGATPPPTRSLETCQPSGPDGERQAGGRARKARGKPHRLIAATSYISSRCLPPLRNGKCAHQRNRMLLSILSNTAKNAAVSGESLLVRAQASSVRFPTGITAIRIPRPG